MSASGIFRSSAKSYLYIDLHKRGYHLGYPSYHLI